MRKHILSVIIKKPFGNLFRQKHVLVVCQDNNGKIILGGKKAYPEGISRLLGGGVDSSDLSLVAAVRREILEELRINIDENRFRLLLEIEVNATDSENKKYSLVTYIYFIKLGTKEKIKPGDDVSSLVYLNVHQLSELVFAYKNIPENLVGVDGKREFYWKDYGKVYGPIHNWVLEALEEQQAKQ